MLIVDMFHVSQEKTYFVCYSLPNAPVWASAIFSDHFIPANHNWAIDKQYPIKSNEQKKKELFRYLFVFLTIYFKYFEGEFWWAKGLRVRKECYARASRRVTMESRLLWIQLQIWKQKVIRVAIFELVIQFTLNVPFELNFG